MPFWFAVLLGFGAVARVTRFLNADVLFDPVRDWVEGRTHRGKLWYLLSCPWCASIWLAAPAAAAVTTFTSYAGWWPNLVTWVGLWLSYSWVYGLAATNLDGD